MRSLTILALLCVAGNAGAQSTGTYVGLKGGPNWERAEDNLRGVTAGVGVLIVHELSPRWAVDTEFWRPGAITTNNKWHRDTLVSLGLRRSYGSDSVRPYVLFGLTATHTTDEFTTCTAIRSGPPRPAPVEVVVSCEDQDVIARTTGRLSGTSPMGLAGAGTSIALSDRTLALADVRIAFWMTAVIIRPTLAVGFRF